MNHNDADPPPDPEVDFCVKMSKENSRKKLCQSAKSETHCRWNTLGVLKNCRGKNNIRGAPRAVERTGLGWQEGDHSTARFSTWKGSSLCGLWNWPNLMWRALHRNRRRCRDFVSWLRTPQPPHPCIHDCVWMLDRKHFSIGLLN